MLAIRACHRPFLDMYLCVNGQNGDGKLVSATYFQQNVVKGFKESFVE
jgi:hypothetical protein